MALFLRRAAGRRKAMGLAAMLVLAWPVIMMRQGTLLPGAFKSIAVIARRLRQIRGVKRAGQHARAKCHAGYGDQHK